MVQPPVQQNRQIKCNSRSPVSQPPEREVRNPLTMPTLQPTQENHSSGERRLENITHLNLMNTLVYNKCEHYNNKIISFIAYPELGSAQESWRASRLSGASLVLRVT